MNLLKGEKRIESEYSTKQMAYKVLLNSAYGALGQQYFKFFDIRQAEAITLTGQLTIKWIEVFLNEYLSKICGEEDSKEPFVVYMDTDSSYVTLEKLVNKVGLKDAPVNQIIDFMDKACKKISKEIDKEYLRLSNYTNSFKHNIVMERESLADKGFWTRKKRYALNVYDMEGVRFKDPHLKIMGLETARSSTPAICREKLEEAIRLILTTDEKQVIEFIESFRKEYMNLPIGEIANTTGVSDIEKHITKNGYAKGTPIHVRGSILYNNWIKSNKFESKYECIRSGDKIKTVYLTMPNPIGENTIAFIKNPPEEMNLKNYVDYGKQYAKTFLTPLQTILECIGWEWENKTTLENFFQ